MKKRNLQETLSDDPSFFADPQQQEALVKAIDQLSADTKLLLLLYYTHPLPVKEIALRLNCSVSNVYNQLNTALFQLKQSLNPHALEGIYNILYPEHKKPVPFSAHSSAS
jgi:RNA polymerase sigma factor (sigma-70 family)